MKPLSTVLHHQKASVFVTSPLDTHEATPYSSRKDLQFIMEWTSFDPKNVAILPQYLPVTRTRTESNLYWEKAGT